jgi:hypothetical protein
VKYAYIAGPITGHADWNRPAFEAARLEVERITGARVTIPHDFVKESDAETTAMVLCLVAICDTVKLGVPFFIVLLPNWRDSLGTAVEVALARKLGVPVVELVDGALIELESVILCTDKQTNECPRCGNSGEHSNPGTSDQEGQRG